MGLDDKGISSVGTDIDQVVLDLIEQMSDDESELLSIYYGSDVSKEQADNLVAMIQEKYPDYEIEVHSGGQPIYYYILSIE